MKSMTENTMQDTFSKYLELHETYLYLLDFDKKQKSNFGISITIKVLLDCMLVMENEMTDAEKGGISEICIQFEKNRHRHDYATHEWKILRLYHPPVFESGDMDDFAEQISILENYGWETWYTIEQVDELIDGGIQICCPYTLMILRKIRIDQKHVLGYLGHAENIKRI